MDSRPERRLGDLEGLSDPHTDRCAGNQAGLDPRDHTRVKFGLARELSLFPATPTPELLDQRYGSNCCHAHAVDWTIRSRQKSSGRSRGTVSRRQRAQQLRAVARLSLDLARQVGRIEQRLELVTDRRGEHVGRQRLELAGTAIPANRASIRRLRRRGRQTVRVDLFGRERDACTRRLAVCRSSGPRGERAASSVIAAKIDSPDGSKSPTCKISGRRRAGERGRRSAPVSDENPPRRTRAPRRHPRRSSLVPCPRPRTRARRTAADRLAVTAIVVRAGRSRRPGNPRPRRQRDGSSRFRRRGSPRTDDLRPPSAHERSPSRL